MGPAVFELDRRAGDEIPDGARDQDLAWCSECPDPGADRHRDTDDVAVDKLDLASVQTRADLDTERLHAFADRLRASHRAAGSIERRQEAVAILRTSRPWN